MSKSKAITRVVPLDPEFEAVYSGTVEPKSAPLPSDEPSETDEDELSALKRLAIENQSRGQSRKAFADGSFDQVATDAENAGRLLFNYLTRPL